jgi:hypothetical protein
MMSAFHLTEAEAEADTVFVRQDTSLHRHLFAYQEQKWEPKSRKYQSIGSSVFGEESFPCDELLVKGETPSRKDVHGCLEEFDGGN